MKIDSTKDALTNVWALINAANGTNLSAGQGLSLGLPSDHAGQAGRNTVITATADQNGPYIGSQDLYYTRLGLTQSVNPAPTVLNVSSRTDTQEIIQAAIASLLNLVPAEFSIVETVVADMTAITLRPKANSLLYLGDSPFSLRWPSAGGSQTIDQLLPQSALPGFDSAYTNLTSLIGTQSLPGFDTVPWSTYAWSSSAVPSLATTSGSTMVLASGKLWHCDGWTLRAFDPYDGTLLSSLDIVAYVGGTQANSMYWIQAVDGNGLIWLATGNNIGYLSTRPSIVRVDSSLGVIKDGLLGGTSRSSGNEYTQLSGNGSSDFIWSIHMNKPSGGSATYTLAKHDIVTGNVLAEYSPVNMLSNNGLLYDTTNRMLWRGYARSPDNKIDVNTLDSSNNPSLLVTEIMKAGSASSYRLNSLLAANYTAPSGSEVAVFDVDRTTNQIYISRYKATDGTLIASVAPSDSNLVYSTNPSSGFNGPLKYNTVTDELFALVYYLSGGTTFKYELWAFKRTDTSQSRVVLTDDGQHPVKDFALDASGNVYAVVYDNTAGTYSLFQSRQS